MDIKAQFEAQNQKIIKNEQKIQEVENKTEDIDKKVEMLLQKNEGLEQTNQELERAMAMVEMREAEHYLRFQNIPEDSEENIETVIIELLAELLNADRVDIQNETDQIFRMNSSYARKNRLPREVHVRFMKKSTRDEVLRKVREEPLQYKNKEIVVLKQIPRRVRDTRRHYHFLTTKLIAKGINFRWLMPEGILINWNNTRYRLDSIWKAEDFEVRNRVILDEGLQQQEDKQTGETAQGATAQAEQQQEKSEQTGEGEGTAREQRTTRSTRPKYK